MFFLKINKAYIIIFINFATSTFFYERPGGGIGRRVGLKNQLGNTSAGSIPAQGTKALSSFKVERAFLFTPININT